MKSFGFCTEAQAPIVSSEAETQSEQTGQRANSA